MSHKTKELLPESLYVLQNYLAWILLGGVLVASLAFGYVTFFVRPTYEATITIVINRVKDTQDSFTAADVADSTSVVNTCRVVLRDGVLLRQTTEALGLERHWMTIRNNLTISAVKDTPVIVVAVRDHDPDEALRIVLKLSELAPPVLRNDLRAVSCKVIGDAYCSGVPVSPNVVRTTQSAFLLGSVGCFGLFLLYQLTSSLVEPEDVEELSGVPLLSIIPIPKHSQKRSRRS